jgi:hypothetical protein
MPSSRLQWTGFVAVKIDPQTGVESLDLSTLTAARQSTEQLVNRHHILHARKILRKMIYTYVRVVPVVLMEQKTEV